MHPPSREPTHVCPSVKAKNRDHFSQFLTEDFDDYLHRKRAVDAHGNHVELQAISEIFSRPIEIFEYSIGPINTFHPISPEANSGCQENAPLRLSYHGTVHYNSVIDSYTATIGVGLGLPGFQPGAADRSLMKEAIGALEAQHIEEAMLKDKLRMTDWERTEEELSKQIAKDSYMEYVRELEEKARRGSRGMTSTKRGASSPNIPCCSRDGRSPLPKVQRDGGSIGGGCHMLEYLEGYSSSMPNIAQQDPTMRPSTSVSSFTPIEGGGLYEELLASSEASALDEAAMIAQAMALSQQEFYESLKK